MEVETVWRVVKTLVGFLPKSKEYNNELKKLFSQQELTFGEISIYIAQHDFIDADEILAQLMRAMYHKDFHSFFGVSKVWMYIAPEAMTFTSSGTTIPINRKTHEAMDFIKQPFGLKEVKAVTLLKHDSLIALKQYGLNDYEPMFVEGYIKRFYINGKTFKQWYVNYYKGKYKQKV